MSEAPLRQRRSRRRRRRVAPWLVGAALVVAFVVGIAFGEALHDNPSPGGNQTLVRTLTPLPLAPAAGSTTVTVTGQKP